MKEAQISQTRIQLFERRPQPRGLKPGDYDLMAEVGKIYSVEEIKRTVKTEAEEVKRQWESESEQ